MSIVHENQTVTDRKLMPEIFNDHFVHIGESLPIKLMKPIQTLLKKGSLLKSFTQTRFIEPYLNLKLENQLEQIIFQTRP